jgi:hypothetical protein
MNSFQLFGQYFWVLLLVFSVFNYITARHWINSSGAVSPGNLESANRYIVWLALGAALPWLLMGFMQSVGRLSSAWYFLRSQDHNPYVIIWITFVIALSVLYAGWILFAGGAQKVRAFQLMAIFGMRNAPGPSERMIKILAALTPFAVLGGVYFAMSTNVPMPH